MDKVIAPDFAQGVPVEGVPDGGMIQGTVAGVDVILARRGAEFFAVGAKCPHYGGPLGKGLIVADEVRCPLHHSSFSLRTGAVLRPPAFDSIPCWRVERIGSSVFVREQLPASHRAAAAVATDGSKVPTAVVIVGGGGAGLAAADTLRREGYDGPLTILSADEFPPYDRPNLSKDYLAGTAPDEWMPLRSPQYYSDRHIELALNSRVTSLDIRHKRVQTENGGTYDFDRLLLATGAAPIRLPITGAGSPIAYLRSYADSRALIARAASAKQVVIVGSSFIGLEVAASLRARGIAVHVVARDRLPFERVLGPDIGRFVRSLHESQGVVFHFEDTVTRLAGRTAVLESGGTVGADFLVVGVGVRPLVELAQQAGLKVDRGVVVNEHLETSAPGVFAAGDVARWPDVRTNELVRIEHWVVAERQGQVAARNILGRRERFDAVPFFWTRQYGVSIKYVGHAPEWDAIELSGSVAAKDCAVTYQRAGRTLAVATISRDLQNLQAEAAMEAGS